MHVIVIKRGTSTTSSSQNITSLKHSRVEGKKVFMGVAQIMLDDLDLSNIVIGWYKLFGTSSLVNVPPGGGKDKKKESSV